MLNALFVNMACFCLQAAATERYPMGSDYVLAEYGVFSGCPDGQIPPISWGGLLPLPARTSARCL